MNAIKLKKKKKEKDGYKRKGMNEKIMVRVVHTLETFVYLDLSKLNNLKIFPNIKI